MQDQYGFIIDELTELIKNLINFKDNVVAAREAFFDEYEGEECVELRMETSMVGSLEAIAAVSFFVMQSLGNKYYCLYKNFEIMNDTISEDLLQSIYIDTENTVNYLSKLMESLFDYFDSAIPIMPYGYKDAVDKFITHANKVIDYLKTLL